MRRDSIPLQSRPIRFCRIEDFIPGGYILHPLLHVSGHLANYAAVLVHGVASASNQGLGYLLRELGHLEDGRKARERGQGGGEPNFSDEPLTNLQMTLSYLRLVDFSCGAFINLQMTLSYEGEIQGGLTNFQIVDRPPDNALQICCPGNWSVK